MSTKVTKRAVEALFSYTNKRISANTEVSGLPNRMLLLLHHNCIAKLEQGKLYIRSGGYETQTTKERLNGLPGVSIYQKDFQWYLNDKIWQDTDQWTAII